MSEIMCTSQELSQRAEPLSWLRRIFQGLGQPRPGRTRRLDEQTWSSYMLRDIGLDEGRGAGDPRNLPLDWPLR